MLCFHAAQTGKHLFRTQNVSEQNQKHFLCPGHKICVAQANLCVGNNVSATRCPHLQGPITIWCEYLEIDLFKFLVQNLSATLMKDYTFELVSTAVYLKTKFINL